MKPTNRKIKKKKETLVFHKGEYAVVKFTEERNKLFESIPEFWFFDEERTSCFWPPKGGRSATLRAIDQDMPDCDWEVYECTVVSSGHETYSIAASVVREKCSQPYNTSSADDHIEAARFKRAHPGLVDKGKLSLENVFDKRKEKEIERPNSKRKTPERNVDENINESHPKLSLSENVVLPVSVNKKAQQSGSYTGHNSRPGSNSYSGQTKSTHFYSGRSSTNMRLSRSGSSSTRSSSNRSSRFSDRRSIRSSYRSVSRSSHPSNRTSTRSRSQSSRRSSRSGTAFTRRSQSRSSRRSDRRSIRSSCRSVSRSSHSNRTSTRSRSRSSRRSNRSGTSFTRRSQSRSSRRSGRSSIRSSRRSDSPYCHHSNRVSIQSTRHRSGSHSTRHTGNGSSHCSSRNTSRSQSRRSNENAKLVSAKRFDNAVRSSPQGRKSDDLPAGRDGNNRQNVRGESGLWDTLTKSVNEMKELLVKIGRRTNENDRRLSRVEVTANKTLVLVGDLVNSYDARMSILHASKSREAKPPSGYRFPKLPIRTQDELSILRRDLKNKNFFSFLVNDQKQYCTPSQATDNVIMTGFLKRFISVSVRAELVLKDLKGKTGKTLFHDFREVYDFIIEVFKAGFEVRNKIRTNAEAQSVLRVVWGRSKQMLNEEISKKRRN